MFKGLTLHRGQSSLKGLFRTTCIKGLHSLLFHRETPPLCSAHAQQQAGCHTRTQQMSMTASLSSEELSLSVFLLFCSVLLEITSRDKSVFLYFCLLTRCQAREGVYSSQGGEEEWMCACIARTSKKQEDNRNRSHFLL